MFKISHILICNIFMPNFTQFHGLLNNFVTIEDIQNMNNTIAIGCDRKDENASNYHHLIIIFSICRLTAFNHLVIDLAKGTVDPIN